MRSESSHSTEGDISGIKRSLIWRILSHKALPLFELMLMFYVFTFFYLFRLGSMFSAVEENQHVLNEKQMLRVNMALQTYHWANHLFPQEIGELIGANESRNLRIPYVTPDLLTDAWGTPYQYQRVPEGFILTSLGADRQSGGEGVNKDIVMEGP